jgi:hypothetical protein
MSTTLQSTSPFGMIASYLAGWPQLRHGPVRFAILLQLAPILAAIPVIADGVLNAIRVPFPSAWYPLGDPHRWPLQALSLLMLLSGTGYLVLGRWGRFMCVWLAGVACFATLQASLAASDTGLEVVVGLWVPLFVALAVVDLGLLAIGRNIVGSIPGALKVLASVAFISISVLTALFWSLVLLLTVACRASYTHCI